MSNLLINVTPFKSILTESKMKPGVFEVTGIMQRAGAKNQNGRIYKREILEQEVQNYIENFVKIGNAYGELDHPESAIVSLKNASHVVKELWWEGDDLMGKLELLNTPSGNIVKEIIRGGHTMGISSRGTGSVTQTNEGTLMVQPDFELVCWDFVSNPSTQGAFMNPISLNEGKQTVGKYDRLDSIINNILRA
ncbi:prohead core scaffolding protein and protease [uncultured Caudovirales phage]|uniref:Prohead core scaffolding protein and protease n=1 Tax=uncultured Caudovirales phage TaxID=2100421 RepID=A0A6J5KSN9_9CAUD|nr:prohead core scaffolding protein and protease [uncultured Caudovirales phage]